VALGVLPVVAASAPDLGWPRHYTDGNARLVLYQPQVDSWKDFKKLDARFAASLTVQKHAQPIWGVLSIEFGTAVDLKTRTVAFENFRVVEMRYPAARDRAEAAVWEALTIKLLPARPETVALDRILAYLGESQWHARETKVLLDPPPILVSTEPAVLVMIDGRPIGLDIAGTQLRKIVNTNWDLFFDKSSKCYYLRDDRLWLSAAALDGPWAQVVQLPADFSRLPATELYRDALQAAAAKPQKRAAARRVFVAGKPSELIVLAGNPALAPVPDTRLLWVSNTECDLFFDPASRQYYFLTSGRWFRAADLKNGPWTAATGTLPEDFTRIPTDHARAHVLASVPGTRQAQEAVLGASIPQLVTVSRDSVRVDVKYAGEPEFQPLAGGPVAYAVNTPKDVFRADGRYYLCLDGVWYLSQQAAGPWQLADAVPQDLYDIPPSSPKYHVTFVTVSSVSLDEVSYRYSAGYNGAYVAHGVVMWGTGYDYPSHYAPGAVSPMYWPSPYYTYGASMWYSPVTGSYARGSLLYGPYGGYARAAAWDPAGGAWSWSRPLGGYGPRYRISSGIQASVALKGKAGDFYAGKDGNVYKRDASGQWSRSDGASWMKLGDGDARESVQGLLNRDSSARQWGNYNTQRFDSEDKLGGWTSDGFIGWRESGWKIRSPGFGGKK
jgi:hypothetical protein